MTVSSETRRRVQAGGSGFARLPRMHTPLFSRNRRAAALFAALALTVALTACGGGETTVTVTETVAEGSPPSQEGGQTTSTEVATEGPVTGYVDDVNKESDKLVLMGWAASADLSGPATKVTASVGGKVEAQAVPAIERQDVVEALGKPGLKESGFELQVPLAALECNAAAAGLEVVASLNGKSGPLGFGEGVEEEVVESC